MRNGAGVIAGCFCAGVALGLKPFPPIAGHSVRAVMHSFPGVGTGVSTCMSRLPVDELAAAKCCVGGIQQLNVVLRKRERYFMNRTSSNSSLSAMTIQSSGECTRSCSFASLTCTFAATVASGGDWCR